MIQRPAECSVDCFSWCPWDEMKINSAAADSCCDSEHGILPERLWSRSLATQICKSRSPASRKSADATSSSSRSLDCTLKFVTTCFMLFLVGEFCVGVRLETKQHTASVEPEQTVSSGMLKRPNCLSWKPSALLLALLTQGTLTALPPFWRWSPARPLFVMLCTIRAHTHTVRETARKHNSTKEQRERERER